MTRRSKLEDLMEEDSSQSIWSHLEMILANSSRPSALASVYGGTPRKNTSSGSGTSQASKKKSLQRKEEESVKKRESVEREEAEERYDRVVLSAIRAMDALWERMPEEKEGFRYGEEMDRGLIWRHLASSRSSFRRASYHLLATATQYTLSAPPHPVPTKQDDDKKTTKQPKKFDIASSILASLEMEKDPSNITPFLTSLLLFLDVHPETRWIDMDCHRLCKGMGRLLRNAAYGATSGPDEREGRWTHLILPLVALLPEGEKDYARNLLNDLVSRCSAYYIYIYESFFGHTLLQPNNYSLRFHGAAGRWRYRI